MSQYALRVLLAGGMWYALSAAGFAAGRQIWLIGRLDESGREFIQNWWSKPPVKPVVYRVGTSVALARPLQSFLLP